MPKVLIVISEPEAQVETESLQQQLREFGLSYQLRSLDYRQGEQAFQLCLKEFQHGGGQVIVNFSRYWQLQAQILSTLTRLPILNVAFTLPQEIVTYPIVDSVATGFFGANRSGLSAGCDFICRLLALQDDNLARAIEQQYQRTQLMLQVQTKEIRVDYEAK